MLHVADPVTARDGDDVLIRMVVSDDGGEIATLGGRVEGGDPGDCLDALDMARRLGVKVLGKDRRVLERLFQGDPAALERVLAA